MDIPDNTSFNAGVLIILCGLVGSGKSTFATALQREFPEFRRCNQDELGRREDVEREVTVALSQGLQRRTWIDIARQYSGVEIWGIKMDTPYNTCHARLIERKEHPTLKTPEKAVEVLSRFSSQFVPINVNEGFNRVYSIVPQESPDYTREELEIILTAIRESPYTPSLDSLPPLSNSSRGRGGRGRGSFPNQGYRGHGSSNSHGWRSHHASSWGPNPRDTPPQRDGDNWRTQAPISTNVHRDYGYPNRGQGRYRGRGGPNYNSSPGQGHGNYGAYPRGPIPRGWYQSTPRPIPPLLNSDPQSLASENSDVPGSV